MVPLSCLLALLVAVGPARADSAAIGFSNLIYRVDGDPKIGIAKHDYRIHVLEELRRLGFNAVGAEDLVFDKDRSRAAELVLGGTMRELECQEVEGSHSCRAGIEWQLLELERDRVVYKVMTRFAVYDHDQDPARVGRALVLGALKSMTNKDGFRDLVQRARVAPSAPSFETDSFRGCASAASPMPGSAEGVLRATVVIETGAGFGSGFYLSPDGLVLTAAHVVQGASRLKVRQRDGKEFPAVVLRGSPKSDVAVLKVDRAGGAPCLGLAAGETPTGADVYAIGAPTSTQLGFSLTRGIVSGARTIDDQKLLQTDASVSPGNSGGPLVDAQGRVVGVVSFKVLGAAVEGVAFGVPVHAGLAALGLRSGDRTGAKLLEDRVQSVPLALGDVLVDAEDDLPPLDRPVDFVEQGYVPEPRGSEREREPPPPGHIQAMRWGGLAVAGAGLVVALRSAVVYDAETTTRDDFQSLRLQNDLGWAAVGLGAASIALSLLIEPDPPKRAGSAPAGRASLLLGPGAVGARVTY